MKNYHSPETGRRRSFAKKVFAGVAAIAVSVACSAGQKTEIGTAATATTSAPAPAQPGLHYPGNPFQPPVIITGEDREDGKSLLSKAYVFPDGALDIETFKEGVAVEFGYGIMMCMPNGGLQVESDSHPSLNDTRFVRVIEQYDSQIPDVQAVCGDGEGLTAAKVNTAIKIPLKATGVVVSGSATQLS